MDDDEALRIHGQLDPRLMVPVQVEHGGRRLRVVSSTPRQDLQLAAWNAGKHRTYRELQLSDGSRLLVFHDLVRGGWYEIPPITLQRGGSAQDSQQPGP